MVETEWVVDDNGSQMVDDSNNWVYAGELAVDGEGEYPPQLVANQHYHGLQTKRIANKFIVPIDHDACVASAEPAVNFGSSSRLGVLWDEGPAPDEFVYVYMKASTLTNFNAGHTLDAGYLFLKREHSPWLGDGAGHISDIEVRRIAGADWDESTITWNTKPAEGSESFNTHLVQVSADTWLVTNDDNNTMKTWLSNWIDGTWNNYGLALKPIHSDPIKRFFSSEATISGDRPYFALFFWPF